MKARTASQKRKSKRGRPKLPAESREPSGRPSRRKASRSQREDMTAAEAMSVAVERRIRHDNIVPFREKGGKVVTAEEQAKDQKRGYTLGLMYLDHTITQSQHDAGVKFAEDMARYYGLTGVAFPSARAQNLFAVRGNEGDETESKSEAAKKARIKAQKLRDVLLGVGNIDEGRKITSAITEVALLDNVQCRKWPDHMLWMIRRGLNRLADYYGCGTD